MGVAQSWERLGQDCHGLGGQGRLDEWKKPKGALDDKTKVVTSALDSVKLRPYTGEKREGKGKKVNRKKTPRDL